MWNLEPILPSGPRPPLWISSLGCLSKVSCLCHQRLPQPQSSRRLKTRKIQPSNLPCNLATCPLYKFKIWTLHWVPRERPLHANAFLLFRASQGFGFTLYTETTLTRLHRKVHAILFKATRSVDVYTVSTRTPDPSEPSCSIKTVRRVLRQRTDLQEIVKELIRAKGDTEERREEARGPISVLFQHVKILGWTLSDQLVITREYGVGHVEWEAA